MADALSAWGRWTPWILLACLMEAGAGTRWAPEVDVESALWPLMGAVLMELAAVPLPKFGFFSMATPFYILMLLQPRIGFIPPALVGCAAALVRALLVGCPSGGGRLREALGQISPLLTAGLVVQLLSPRLGPDSGLLGLFCLQMYLLTAWKIPRLLAEETLSGEDLAFWRKVYARSIPITAGVLCAGLFMAYYPGHPSWLLLACPAMLALRESFYSAVIKVETLEKETLRLGLARTTHQLDEAIEEQGRTRQELTRRTDQVTLLEGLTRALAESPDPTQTMDLILQIARKTSACQTIAIFGPEEDGLFPQRFVSPQAERLASSRLLRVGERVVLEAWRTGAVEVTSSQHPQQDRLLPGEVGLALPLGRMGVLYVGDTRRRGFSADEVDQLRTLAAQGALCLQCAHYFTRMQRSLVDYAQAHDLLRTWTQGLDRVLEGAWALHSSLDAGALEGLLRAAVQAVVPHDFFCLFPPGPRQLDPGLQEVARVVLESGRPLLFEDLTTTRFALASGEIGSLLAVPLTHYQRASAVVLVGRARTGQFDRLTQDLLSLLACQAGAAWQNADAYQRLRDSEAQLVQSGKMAAVGQLAAGVAHELNSPLGAIVLGVEGAINLLEKKPERARERLRSAFRSASQAQEIVSKLLFYARDGTRVSEPFDLNLVVEDTLGLLSHQLALDGVRIVRESAPVPAVKGTQGEIQQVIMNLLLNARDAASDPASQGPEIRVSTRAQGQTVVLEVADRGPGIPPDLLDRIFDPFFTTKPVGKGTGLGLSVSQQIVQQHPGGSLTVTSRPGEGACFSLTLPAC